MYFRIGAYCLVVVTHVDRSVEEIEGFITDIAKDGERVIAFKIDGRTFIPQRIKHIHFIDPS
jgi:hypothetical protein